MTVIPFTLPWEPDKGAMSTTSLDYILNLLPGPESWVPLPDFTSFSQALPSECKGCWWFRSDAGVFNTVAATQTMLYRLNSATLGWLPIGKLGADTAVNGTFAVGTNWTLGTGVTISGGVAVFTTSAINIGLSQAQTLTAGSIFKVTYTVTALTLGGVRPTLTGGTQVNGTTVTAVGTYTDYLTAVTGNTTFGFQGTAASNTLQIDNVTIQAMAAYTGPGDGDLWTATVYGGNLYVTNINDPLQITSTTSVSNFADATGSPPQAKYIATIGDFLFLAHLKVAAVTYPRKWQHSKINNPANWVIDGSPGASDDQEIPDGDDIVAVLPMAGASARIIQKRARRALTFTPGGLISFQQSDIDATRGAVAAHTCVALGSNQYFYLTENGFCMNDEYRPIGAERIDRMFMAAVDPARLYAVKAAVDPGRKIVWVTYKDAGGTRRTLGYHWYLDRWFQADDQVVLYVTTVSPGYVLDSLTGVLNDYPSPPLDSPFWAGGVVNFGAFLTDNKLYLYGGTRSSATIDTTTMQLTEGTGAFVWGAEVIGDLADFTIQHSATFTPNQTPNWSAARTRSNITGIAPFSRDGKWHRFRVNINTGGNWTHLHGLRPYAKPSSIA